VFVVVELLVGILLFVNSITKKNCGCFFVKFVERVEYVLEENCLNFGSFWFGLAQLLLSNNVTEGMHSFVQFILLQTGNHASTSSLNLLPARSSTKRPANCVKALKANCTALEVTSS